ncbi:hypothetical protein F2Q68_00003657 [Brassica cretica]|uniref:Uncharacterized protein n=1 Tax=Brassica cretica TaxID=69181 RepID=A0A8S9JGF7_BRACR|nr:hypothetical protein F2Q68_00003657 [Brassica cretica]
MDCESISVSDRRITPSYTFYTIASQALEFRAAGSVDIIPSSLSLPFDQVMHLYLNSPIPIASSYFHKTYGGKSVAFMLLLTANLVDFSFMEFMLFPKFPLVFSGIVAGSLMSIATNASMFVLFKGSAFRCIVTSAFIADFRIDILAQCAVPISGVGLLSVADNPQLDFPLLSITEVDSGFVVSFFEHLLLSWRVNLVWYYNNALGRPEKKKFIARKKSYHSSILISISLSRLQVLHQNFDLPAPFVLHIDCPHYCRFHHPEDFSIRLAKNLEDLIIKEGPETLILHNDNCSFMDTKRGFKGHAEPPFKEKIKELIENGTLKKSREVPHAKAVAKSFEKPCAKSKFTILITLNYAVFFAYISLRERENMNLMCCSSSNATKYGGVRKIESVTLAELNSFVLNASPQCFRILQQGFSSFTCASCNEENAVGVVGAPVEAFSIQLLIQTSEFIYNSH